MTKNKSKWDAILTEGNLEKAGKNCGTMQDLVLSLSKLVGETLTESSLFNGFKRNRERLGLSKSIMDYTSGLSPVGKDKPKKPGDIKFALSEERKKALSKTKRVVITASLNNSPLEQKVWGALKLYAKENDAEIVVLPVRYKNPTNRIDGKIVDEGAWWPSEVLPYMTDELLEIHEHFWIMGHAHIQATAAKPLTSLESLSKGASAAFGHGQLAMKMIPTPQNKLPKVLYTTGSISQANYSTTKAGLRGDANHSLGALVVELDGPRFYPRALVADDSGGFYDVDRYYTHKGSKASKGALALVTGDEHALFNDPKCCDATYMNRYSIANVTKPKQLVRHDVFDGYSVNHHSDKDPVTQMTKHEAGFHSVEQELQLTVDYITRTTPKNTKNLIVSSNHHDHLLQWMKAKTPLDSPSNGRFWHHLWGLLLPTMRMGPNGAECGDPFALWSEKRLKRTEFLGSETRTIAGIDISHHGHSGSNGSRGSINQFAKVGVDTVIAHSHTPGIQNGCYQVGTSSMLKLEYTSGLSSWAHCHCVIHPNGKRQLLFVVDGFWRL